MKIVRLWRYDGELRCRDGFREKLDQNYKKRKLAPDSVDKKIIYINVVAIINFFVTIYDNFVALVSCHIFEQTCTHIDIYLEYLKKLSH